MSEAELLVSLLFESSDIRDGAYAYAPAKEFGSWKQHFFKLPEEKDKLILHLQEAKEDVYLSPALWKKPQIYPWFFKSTRYLWAEFDKELPSPEKIGFLTPTIRIQSSLPGREHWYWRLNELITTKQQVEEYAKRLAYYLGADLSCWDYQQVLRPPGSYNSKRKVKAKLLESNSKSYPLQSFNALPRVPSSASVEISLSNLPSLESLKSKYRWSPDAQALLHSVVKQGSRSEALTKFAFELVEMGMSNEEVYVVLEDACRRWKKFAGRTDLAKQVKGVISYVRAKKALTSEALDTTPVYRYKDFMQTQIMFDWVIEGILPVAGSGIIFGPSEVGKSTLILRMAIAIALGDEKFLHWDIKRRQKVLFISLEMPHDELKAFFQSMDLSEHEDELQENLFVWPIGHKYPFDKGGNQQELLDNVDRYGIELVIIDSLGVSMSGSIQADEDIGKLNAFLNEELRVKRKCGYFFVHHPRKPPSGEKKPKDYNDMYGSTYITNNAQTVLLVTPVTSDVVKLLLAKSRMSLERPEAILKRTKNRDFEVITKEGDDDVSPKGRERAPKQRKSGGIFGSMQEGELESFFSPGN